MKYQNATKEESVAITTLVKNALILYSTEFKTRHIKERNNPQGTLNMKIHNAFIAALGSETQYYTSLVRSFDSSFGNMLEKLAIDLAQVKYAVEQHVEGPLSSAQTHLIAEVLEEYKRHVRKPSVADYKKLRVKPALNSAQTKRHESDYYLVDRETGENFLIELKIGGDLDNKKARSEKEALLEQYAILSNTLPERSNISIYFGTAYNRFGEENPWTQGRVRQFFAEEELLIGREFWNFITKADDGYRIVMAAYKDNVELIRAALAEIKALYLGSE